MPAMGLHFDSSARFVNATRRLSWQGATKDRPMALFGWDSHLLLQPCWHKERTLPRIISLARRTRSKPPVSASSPPDRREREGKSADRGDRNNPPMPPVVAEMTAMVLRVESAV